MSAVAAGALALDEAAVARGALAVIVLASFVLGRRQPGWGFVGPALLGAVGLVAVVLAAEPPVPDGDVSERGLSILYLSITTVSAELAVAAGAMTRLWQWTSQEDP
jgi:hypothetical protein